MTVIIGPIGVVVSFNWTIYCWGVYFSCGDGLGYLMSVVGFGHCLSLGKGDWAWRSNSNSCKLALNDWVAINNNCSCVGWLFGLSYMVWSNNFLCNNCPCGFGSPSGDYGLCFSLNWIFWSYGECFEVSYSFFLSRRSKCFSISFNFYWWSNGDLSCFNDSSWMIGPWWSVRIIVW
jgi:hypothetical protein